MPPGRVSSGSCSGRPPCSRSARWRTRSVRGPGVRYFDILPTEKLREKAAEHGLDASRCPDIDYYDENADLGVIGDRFEAVVSSHSIEHQPDLVQHLCDVGGLLEPGGYYFLAIPDHRYCFDHFLAPSTIAQVPDAHLRKARVHSAGNIINMRALITHNDAGRHWNGDHGEPHYVWRLKLCGGERLL